MLEGEAAAPSITSGTTDYHCHPSREDFMSLIALEEIRETTLNYFFFCKMKKWIGRRQDAGGEPAVVGGLAVSELCEVLSLIASLRDKMSIMDRGHHS